jgi:hypothetical protein
MVAGTITANTGRKVSQFRSDLGLQNVSIHSHYILQPSQFIPNLPSLGSTTVLYLCLFVCVCLFVFVCLFVQAFQKKCRQCFTHMRTLISLHDLWHIGASGYLKNPILDNVIHNALELTLSGLATLKGLPI